MYKPRNTLVLTFASEDFEQQMVVKLIYTCQYALLAQIYIFDIANQFVINQIVRWLLIPHL